MLRARTTIDQFRDRFLDVLRERNDLVEQMMALREALRDGSIEPGAAQARMEELRRRLEQFTDRLSQLAGEFSAYDLEKALAATADRMANRIRQSLQHLGWRTGVGADMDAALDVCLWALGADAESRDELAGLAGRAEEVARVARVMDCASWYSALVQRQELLVRRLERYAAGERDVLDPDRMAETQDEIREELVTLAAELEQRASALPDAYAELKQSALDFVDKLRSLEIPVPMRTCAAASRGRRAREAWTEGRTALERMRELVSSCKGGMGGLCRGGIRFAVPAELGATMAQMLESLIERYASGVGIGSIGAAGMGGRGASEGSTLPGMSSLDVPVYGPRRHNPFNMSAGRGGDDGRGPRRGGGSVASAAVSEVTPSSGSEKASGETLDLETVPPRYRSAVRAFYEEQMP
jgi:hypothetical protein